MAVAMSYHHNVWFAAFLASVVTTSAQVVEDCPLGWEMFEDHCYMFYFYPVRDYQLATIACEIESTYLLSINSDAEFEFISQWLTIHDVERSNPWWTSGIGAGQEIRWEGDGTNSDLEEEDKWLEASSQQLASLHIVYKFSSALNSFLWSRQHTNETSHYICEIPTQEAYQINQANRDYSFGANTSDPTHLPRGPQFTIEPESVVIVGSVDFAYVECAADSDPPATYSWYKLTHGVTVPITTEKDTRYSLTNGKFSFQNPNQVLDAGQYFCIARNSFGSIRSHPVLVSFGYIGEFSNDPPGAVRANQYQGTYLDCNPPRYNPEARFQWFRGPGVNFLRTDLNQYQFVSFNGRLYFSEVQPSDAGPYHCVVSVAPPQGQTEATAQFPRSTSLGIELIIRGDTATDFGPTIHNDFPAIFPTPALRGLEIRIECFAYGRMPLKYIWGRDNGPLPPKHSIVEEGRVLLIPDVQLEDSGNYSCRVERSSSASDVKTISLNVAAVPFFAFPLRDQHVDVDSSFTMRCVAMAVPLPQFAWFKDSQPLNTSDGDVQVRGNVVQIFNANAGRHNGIYQCSASNYHGTRTTSAQVRVLAFKPNFSKQPVQATQIATVGGNTTIVCQPEAAPIPVITWLHNNRDLGLSPGGEGRIMILYNGNLAMTQIQQSDQGEYTCRAENTYGSASSSGVLTVVTRTTITNPPRNTEVIVNSTAFLTCQASFDQRHHDIVYVWTFNGHIINIDNEPHFQKSSRAGILGLYVTNAQFEHEGWYECLATTVDDTVSASAFLTVRGPPGEAAGLYGKVVGRDIILSWTPGTTHGSPIIFYIIEFSSDFYPVWRVKANEVPASDTIDSLYPDKRTYQITELSPGSSYTFRIKAVNEYGIGLTSLKSPLYKIPDAPPTVAPEGIENLISTVGILSFAWAYMSPEDLTGEGKGYRLYWRKKSEDIVRDSLWQTDVVDASTKQYATFVGYENYYLPYEIKIAAFNSLGQGPNSSTIVLMSQEDLPIVTPTNVWGEEFNSTAIMVYWDPVDHSRQAMRGKLWGFQINYWWMEDPGYIGSSNVWCDDCEGSMVIGLQPNQGYWVNVQVFTAAGLGPKSEDYLIITYHFAPLLYPEYVSVASREGKSVLVTWRGVPTGIFEEPLRGYRLRWWPATENILTANDTVVAGKVTVAVIEGIQEGIVYALRVLGYSAGGDGRKSPTVYFTLEGMVVYNPVTTEIMATGSYVRASILVFINACLLSWAML